MVTNIMGSGDVIQGQHCLHLWSLCLGALIHHPRSEQDAISVLLKGNKLAAPGQIHFSVIFFFFLLLWCFGKKKNLAFNDSGSQIKFQILASFGNPKDW